MPESVYGIITIIMFLLCQRSHYLDAMPSDDEKRSKPLREPKQDRSKATLARILESARKAMETKNFDDATLAEVVEGAGVTVGAFYARFPDKAALLRFMEQEAYEDLGAVVAGAGEPEPIASASPAQLVSTLLGEMARTYREHRGMISTILLKSRSDPDRQRRRMDFTAEFVRKGISQLQAASASLDHPPSDREWRIALLFALSALRDAIVFEEDWWAGEGDDDETLVAELTSAVLAYLKIPSE